VKTVRVSELKASLSKHLATVKVGEEILVTERGKPVAKLVPVGLAEDNEEQRLARLELKGLLRIGTGKLPKNFWKLPRPKDPKGLLRASLVAERHKGR
jgi:prevent-host-death family protein